MPETIDKGKRNSMKKTVKLLSALSVMFLLGLSACDNGTTSGSGDESLEAKVQRFANYMDKVITNGGYAMSGVEADVVELYHPTQSQIFTRITHAERNPTRTITIDKGVRLRLDEGSKSAVFEAEDTVGDGEGKVTYIITGGGTLEVAGAAALNIVGPVKVLIDPSVTLKLSKAGCFGAGVTDSTLELKENAKIGIGGGASPADAAVFAQMKLPLDGAHLSLSSGEALSWTGVASLTKLLSVEIGNNATFAPAAAGYEIGPLTVNRGGIFAPAAGFEGTVKSITVNADGNYNPGVSVVTSTVTLNSGAKAAPTAADQNINELTVNSGAELTWSIDNTLAVSKKLINKGKITLDTAAGKLSVSGEFNNEGTLDVKIDAAEVQVKTASGVLSNNGKITLSAAGVLAVSDKAIVHNKNGGIIDLKQLGTFSINPDGGDENPSRLILAGGSILQGLTLLATGSGDSVEYDSTIFAAIAAPTTDLGFVFGDGDAAKLNQFKGRPGYEIELSDADNITDAPAGVLGFVKPTGTVTITADGTAAVTYNPGASGDALVFTFSD